MRTHFMEPAMTRTDPPPPSREERLAQQLRANLHRRKAQARALCAQEQEPGLPGPEGKSDLPKS